MAIAGIDLGTTHSLISVYTADGPRLIENPLGAVLTPSAVSVTDDGAFLVGAAARDRLVTHPMQSVASFKRLMGSAKTIKLGGHQFKPEELSALVLRSLLADAEAALGEPIEEAVISVPAYFSDAQRRATQLAGELAGIKVERLINEPTAAALAYGLNDRPDGGTFLIFDLGGGTFDVSILEMFDGVMQVHATAGDNFLGGDDFSHALRNLTLHHLGMTAEALSPAESAVLTSKVDQAKVQLSQRSEVTLSIEIGGHEHSAQLTEAGFAESVQPLLARLRAPIERTLRDAKLKPAALDEIVLVGGASRMPMIARLVTRMFGRLPLRHVQPDQVIALGAGVAAGLKRRDALLSEVVLTDVCTYTLGIAISREVSPGNYQDGFFSPIIERNSTVPISRVESYVPLRDGQRVFAVEVFQGESPRVSSNVHLGRLEVPLVREKVADNAVDVRFTYDVNGVLQVEATTVANQQRHELLLKRADVQLSEAEIGARFAELSALKVHPREAQPNIAVLARAERLFAEQLGETRQVILEGIARFRGTLETQDSTRISREREAFNQLLNDLDDSPL